MGKKFFISCSAALILTFSIAPVSAAPSPTPVSTTEVAGTHGRKKLGGISVTTSDGKNQMRLWSITYSRWLTDWITIN